MTWADISFKQYRQIKGKSLGEVVHLLTGTQAGDRIENLDQITQGLKFLQEPVPTIPPPYKNLELESIGQYEDFKADTSEEKYPWLCAIYDTLPYDFKEAEKKIPFWESKPCGEVIGMAVFILARLKGLKNPTPCASRSLNTHPNKYRRDTRSWISLLGLPELCDIWNHKPRTSAMNSLGGQWQNSNMSFYRLHGTISQSENMTRS